NRSRSETAVYGELPDLTELGLIHVQGLAVGAEARVDGTRALPAADQRVCEMVQRPITGDPITEMMPEAVFTMGCHPNLRGRARAIAGRSDKVGLSPEHRSELEIAESFLQDRHYT